MTSQAHVSAPAGIGKGMSMKAALGAVVLIAFLPAVGATAAAPRPTLKLVDRQPLVIRGESFRPGERVTITAQTGLGARVIRTTARSGVFRVAFRLPDQPCAAAWLIRARGSLGSTAALRLAQSSACIPPPRD